MKKFDYSKCQNGTLDSPLESYEDGVYPCRVALDAEPASDEITFEDANGVEQTRDLVTVPIQFDGQEIRVSVSKTVNEVYASAAESKKAENPNATDLPGYVQVRTTNKGRVIGQLLSPTRGAALFKKQAARMKKAAAIQAKAAEAEMPTPVAPPAN